MTAWSTNGRCAVTAVGSTYHDPDGGTGAYYCKATVSTSGQCYIYSSVTGSITDNYNSGEIWVAAIPGSNITKVSISNTASNFTFETAGTHAGDNALGTCFQWIAETRVVDGVTWYRIQWIPSSSTATHNTMYVYITTDLQNGSFTPTVGDGLMFYKPRSVSTTHLNNTVNQKLACYFDSVQGTMGSTNGYMRYYTKHPYMDSISNMAGGPGGIEWRIVTPPGWTPSGNYPLVLWLMPQTDGAEAGSGNENTTYTMTVDGYAALYNCVMVQPYERTQGYWWGNFSDGTHMCNEFLFRVLVPWFQAHMGVSTNRNDIMGIGYSKSAHALLGAMVYYPDVIGEIAVWDGAFLNSYPANNSDLSYDNSTQYGLHDYLTIVAADGTKRNPLKDFKRVYLTGYYTWGADQLAVKSDFDSNGVPYRYRRVLGSKHSWGSSTSGNAWTQDAMSNLFAMRSAILNPSSRSSMFF